MEFRRPTLEKFDLDLLLLDKGKLDRWDSPYQDVESLAKLGNALVHFKPEWTHDQRKHAKVASALKDRIERSPFFALGEPLFPRAWAGHTTTEWSMTSVADSSIFAFEKCAQLQRPG